MVKGLVFRVSGAALLSLARNALNARIYDVRLGIARRIAAAVFDLINTRFNGAVAFMKEADGASTSVAAAGWNDAPGFVGASGIDRMSSPVHCPSSSVSSGKSSDALSGGSTRALDMCVDLQRWRLSTHNRLSFTD